MLWAGPAWAGKPSLRVSTTPSVGTAAHVHPKAAIVGQARGRFKLTNAGPGDRAGFDLAAGIRGRPHPVVTVGLAYRYGFGHFPIEGPGDREHRASPGMVLATQGARFIVSNNARLDLRAVRFPGAGWAFAMRPRDALRFTAVFHPWMQLSGETELLLQPRDPIPRMLQIRAGIALHGEVPLTREAPEGRRKPPCSWGRRKPANDPCLGSLKRSKIKTGWW